LSLFQGIGKLEYRLKQLVKS